MKTVEKPFQMSVDDTKLWMTVTQQLTAGGTPTGNTRERFHQFRWFMAQNHQRLQSAWDKKAEEINRERVLILVECCGTVDRYSQYETEMQSVFKAFEQYRDQHGKFSFSKTQDAAKRRFSDRVTQVNAKFKDVGQAGEKFAKRQSEMLAEKISVDLICCDYDEVPDDVGCAYISFISQLLMGTPKLRFYHGALRRESRNDPQVAKEIVLKIDKAISDGVGSSKLPSEITMDVFRALYGDDEVAK